MVRGVNAGDHQADADAILLYDKGHLPNGEVVTPKGLPPRRRADRNMYLNGVYDPAH